MRQREILIDRAVDGRNRSFSSGQRAARIFSMMVAAALVASFIIGMSAIPPAAPGSTLPPEAGTISYVSHPVITIGSDAAFATMAGSEGWTGNGTLSNPYIIEGYDINASGASAGIDISLTSVYFTIRDCYLHNATTGTQCGIILSYLTNATLVNNTCAGNWQYGIVLDNTANVFVLGNNCSYNNDSGISCGMVEVCELTGNNCSNNGYNGLFTSSTTNCTISDNVCIDNGIYHIAMVYSTGNDVANNSCLGSSYGVYTQYCANNTIHHNVVPATHYPLYLYDCSGDDIHGNTASSDINAECLHIYLGSWDTISDNDFSGGSQGMSVYDSNNESIVGNVCTGNSGEGILVDSSSKVLVSGNDCTGDQSAVFLSDSDNITVHGNEGTGDGWGIKVTNCNYCAISDNICVSCSMYGAYILNSDNISMTTNEFSFGGSAGIGATNSRNLTMIGNNCSECANGISIIDSNRGTVAGNRACGGSIGIDFSGSGNFSIFNNNCSDGTYGFTFFNSTDNNVFNNKILNNTEYGGRLEDTGCTNNRMWNNTFYHNHGSTSSRNALNVQAGDDGTGNWWNSTSGFGNYWSDWTTPDTALPIGIVDNPYALDGTALVVDSYPRTTVAPAFIPEFADLMMPVLGMLGVISVLGLIRRRKAEG